MSGPIAVVLRFQASLFLSQTFLKSGLFPKALITLTLADSRSTTYLWKMLYHTAFNSVISHGERVGFFGCTAVLAQVEHFFILVDCEAVAFFDMRSELDVGPAANVAYYIPSTVVGDNSG